MSVEQAAYDTVHEFDGGARAVSAGMTIGYQVLVNKVSINNNTHHLTLSEAVRLMHFTGDARILDAMAADFGGIFVPVPKMDGGPGNLVGDLAEMSAEFGSLMREVAEDLADGVVTDNEMARVEREASKLREALAVLLKDLRHINRTNRVETKRVA